MDNYSTEIAANLERSEIFLQAARDMVEKGYHDIAASHAYYYAAFYAASALLLKENIYTSKHSGVIAAIHRYFNWLFELRGVGDYGVSEHVSSGEAYKALKIAEAFLESVKAALK